MLEFSIIWDLEEEPEGNVQHCAEHGVSTGDVEDVLIGYLGGSRRNRDFADRWETIGYTRDLRFLKVVWQHVEDNPFTIYPLTAFEIRE